MLLSIIMIIHNINTKEKVFIIAEIGNNHEGNFSLAEEMICLAAESGADAVKFQTIVPEKLVSLKQVDRINQLKKFQLSYENFKELSLIAEKEGVVFLSTPFDIESALFLNEFLPAFKISSGDNNFFPLIDIVAKTGKPIIMSTGLMTESEVKKSVNFIKRVWEKNKINQELALLHCVSSYPTLIEDANLLSIVELQKISDNVGYSDHTNGIDAAIISIALGARIVEKHFTIDNNYSDFRDHQLSANPNSFREMVFKIRQTEKLLGNNSINPRNKEIENKPYLRRSIVAKYDLPKSHVILPEDLDWVRPGKGLSPGNEKKIIGKKLKNSIKAGEIIKYNTLK